MSVMLWMSTRQTSLVLFEMLGLAVVFMDALKSVIGPFYCGRTLTVAASVSQVARL